MSKHLTQPILLTSPNPLDIRQGVYTTTAEAIASVPKHIRHLGLTVYVMSPMGIVEYWWKSGVNDEDLVAKSNQVQTTEGSWGALYLSSNVIDLPNIYASLFSLNNTVPPAYPLWADRSKNHYLFIVKVLINDLIVTNIIPPHDREFMILFWTDIPGVNKITLKHSAVNQVIQLDTCGIDNVFELNVWNSNWFIGKKNIAGYIRQINSHSTYKPAMGSGEINTTDVLRFVEYLPPVEEAEANILYVVTSYSPNPTFRWNTNLATYTRVGEKETTNTMFSVRAVATSNVNINEVEQIDGIVLTNTLGHYYLLTAQNTSSQNGIWEVESVGLRGAKLRRVSSFFPDVYSYVGIFFKVANGNVFKNSLWLSDTRNWINHIANRFHLGNQSLLTAVAPTIYYMIYKEQEVIVPSLSLNDLQDVIDNGVRGSMLIKAADEWITTNGIHSARNGVVVHRPGGTIEWAQTLDTHIRRYLCIDENGTLGFRRQLEPTIVYVDETNFLTIDTLNKIKRQRATNGNKPNIGQPTVSRYTLLPSEDGWTYRFVIDGIDTANPPLGVATTVGGVIVLAIHNNSAYNFKFEILTQDLVNLGLICDWAEGSMLETIEAGSRYKLYLSRDGNNANEVTISHHRSFKYNEI